MTILPPVAGVQAGHTTGGGLLDTFKNAISGATGGTAGGAPAQVDPGPKGDGSVGLFDGVLKKALFGGAAGAAMGFLPFIPGGPILGGVIGALGGAAMGAFSNWTKMRQIKQENEAMLAAMGVQVQQPEIQQVLQSGNVSQLIPMMQQAQGGTTTQVDPIQQQAVQQQQALAAQQQAAIAQGEVPRVIDPATFGMPEQSPVPTQGLVTVGSGAAGAINPALAVDPGIAPANLGGGGSAGEVGRPPAPVGTPSADVTAIAPVQADIGIPASSTTDAAAGAQATSADIAAQIKVLQDQINLLQQMLADLDRRTKEEEAAQAA